MTWLLPLNHPARLASNVAGMKGIRALEALHKAMGHQLRPKEQR
jgi:hypothetical protein